MKTDEVLSYVRLIFYRHLKYPPQIPSTLDLSDIYFKLRFFDFREVNAQNGVFQFSGGFFNLHLAG
jgi:hypothetical protein